MQDDTKAPAGASERTYILNLDAIEARANAATPGPWRIEREELPEDFSDEEQAMAYPSQIGPFTICEHEAEGEGCVERVEADAAFVAHAAADVPALVAEVRALRDIVGALPVCSACDSAPATNVMEESDFYGCDDHRSPGAVDLPWADELRAWLRGSGS